MRLSRILFPALIACALLTGAVAQDQTPPRQQSADQPPAPTPQQDQTQAAPPSQAALVPDGIAALGKNATSRTEFTLDRSMLALATKLDKNNEDLRKVIAGVNEVSVHSFRYAGAVSRDPAILESIGRQYREAGWMQLLSKHKSDAGVTTDLWVRLDQAAIRDVAVLFAGGRQLSFVSVSGSITPLDLLRLSGHFGIPKMDGGVAVPLPGK
jgi:hypothetical protein